MVKIETNDTSFISKNEVISSLKDNLVFNPIEKLIIVVFSYDDIIKQPMIEDKLFTFRSSNPFQYKLMLNELKLNKFDNPNKALSMTSREEEIIYEIYDSYNNDAYKSLLNNFSSRINLRTLSNISLDKILNLQNMFNIILEPIAEYYESYIKFKTPLKFFVGDSISRRNPILEYIKLNQSFQNGNIIAFSSNLIESRDIFNDIKNGAIDIEFSFCYLDQTSREIIISAPMENETVRNLIL